MAKQRKISRFKNFIHLIQLIGKPTLNLLTFVLSALSYSVIKVKKTILDFKKHLKKKKRRPKKVVRKAKKTKRKKLKNRRHFPFKITVLILGFLAFGFSFYFYILKDLPSVKTLVDTPPSLSTKIYDRHGVLLYQIYKDENRTLIKLADLPKDLVSATLAAEDKNFYHHFGVDLIGISRATFNNLISCKLKVETCTIQGGSTLTQQLVKNTLLTPERTFTRKIKELLLSFATEYTYTKDQILEMYLNQVGYGGTAYGIEEAATQYFNKSARDLTLSESAMLAGLPIAPTILSPFGTNPYIGKIRQQQVLENMVETSAISVEAMDEALSTPLVFHPKGISIQAPHFVMYIKDLLVKQYGEEMVSRGGLEVTTTLDLSTQNILQNEINTELQKLTQLRVKNGAGLIIAPKTGQILAMVGSRDFFDSKNDGQVNIVLQERQPGSSIKPITYALALSRGATPNTYMEDTPICFAIKGQPSYCPKNYDGRFHGRVSLRTSLGSSYNIPAVKLLNTYGLSNMIQLAKQMGITTWNDSSRYGLSLTLGGGEITMLDLAGAYSVFANGGSKIPFTPILSVVDSHGESLPGYPEKSESHPEVLSPGVAYQISSILSDPFARAPAFGLNSVLSLPGKNVAVKTGTTNNLRDNWTLGYTSDFLVATWVGNNDNTPMSSVASGVTGASPIWARTMVELLKTTPATPFMPPESMVKINVACAPQVRFEYFIKGTEPKINCAPKDGTLLPAAASTAQ